MKFYLSLACFLFLFVAIGVAQADFDFYLSNAGNDANAGTLAAPKKTIAGINAAVAAGGPVAAPLKIGFRSGDVFYDSYNPGFPVLAGTYFPDAASKKFAVLNGAQAFNNGWVRTDSTNNIYHQDIPLTGFNTYGINGWRYSYIYVFEIDRQLELTAPITAKRLLKFVPTLVGADSTPGSFYEPDSYAPGVIRVFIHTSNGRPPNNNPQFRYEVSVRDRAINSSLQQKNHFERLWVTGYGAGNGMIPAGANSTFNRMIFGPGAAIHHLGLRGAVITNSLFLPGPVNTNGYAVVFYDVEGLGRHNLLRNCIFLDIRNPVYAHTSYGSRYAALELDNVISFANPAEPMAFIECADTDSVFLNSVYSDGHVYGYASAVPYVFVRNSVIKNCSLGVGLSPGNLSASVYNTYIGFSGGRNAAGIYANSPGKLSVSNCVLHCKDMQPTANPGVPVGAFIINSSSAGSNTTVQGNIFISDVNASGFTVGGIADIANGAGHSTDTWANNVYVLASGSKIAWKIINSDTGASYYVDSFNQWQALSGQDANSLFFDVRNDPRGLKAIFTNPDNGDYSIANTIEGNQIKQLRAGMAKPVSCFLTRPTYEEAASIIMNDGVLTANACRKPCLQNDIRLRNHISSSITQTNQVQVQWDIEDESALDRFEILRSFGNRDFSVIATVPASGNTNYAYTDSNVVPGIIYRYSVAVVTKLVEKCYSAATTVKTNDGQSLNIYPNPSSGKIKLGLNAYTGPVKITIHNVLGRQVYTAEINASYGIPPQIDLSSQSKGFYWIKLQTDKESIMKAFVLH